MGKRMEAIAAVPNNASAVSAYVENFGSRGLAESVDELAQGAGLEPATAAQRSLAQQLGDVDFMLAGPPCQGHSDLYNYTRRSDPKNRLYLAAARFAWIVRPRNIVIENVPGVVHDHRNVVGEARCVILGSLGCTLVGGAVVDASAFGVAQRRRRHFTV